MTKIKNTFESKRELKTLNLRRLVTNQKILLKEISNYIHNGGDKNDAFMSLQQILVINEVMLKKLDKIK